MDLRAGTETHCLRSMLKRSVSCERVAFACVNVFAHSPGALLFIVPCYAPAVTALPSSASLNDHLLEQVCARVIAWMLNARLSAAFFTWWTNAECDTEEIQWQQDVMGKVLARWTNQSLMSAFRFWNARALEQNRTVIVCGKIINKRINRSLDVAFITLKYRVTEQKRMQHVSSSTMKRMNRRLKVAAFASWRKNHRKGELREEAVMIIQHKKYLSDGHAMMLKWRDNAEVS